MTVCVTGATMPHPVPRQLDTRGAAVEPVIGVVTSDEARRMLRQARHRAVMSCYEYWLRARDRSGRLLPGRQHLDPVDMASFLPHVALHDIVRDGGHQRFRNRLIGTHVAEILGRDVTGMYIEHTGWLESFDELYRRFSIVTDEKVLAYGVSPSPEKQRILWTMSTLPCRSRQTARRSICCLGSGVLCQNRKWL